MGLRRHTVERRLVLGTSFLCAIVSLLFGFLYYSLYFQYRDRFNEEGRYFDAAEEVVYHDQSSILLVPALTFFLLSLLLFVWWRRIRGRSTTPATTETDLAVQRSQQHGMTTPPG